MPGYRGHLVGAALSYGLAIWLLYLIPSSLWCHGIWLTCCLAGGLFPDIDTKSKGQRIFYPLFFVAFAVLWWQQNWHMLAALSTFSMIPMCFAHRGLLHNAWFIVAVVVLTCSWLTAWIPSSSMVIWHAGSFFILGVLSHLYLDLGIHRMFKWRI